MPGHVRDGPHACQDEHRRLLHSCLPYDDLPKNHVRSQRRHPWCMDLQYPGHHLPMQAGPGRVGLHTAEKLSPNRQLLLLLDCVLHLHRLLALYPTVARVLETQPTTAAEVRGVNALRDRPFRDRGLGPAHQCSRGGRESRRDARLGTHNEVVRCRSGHRHHLRLHPLFQTSLQELAARQNLAQRLSRPCQWTRQPFPQARHKSFGGPRAYQGPRRLVVFTTSRHKDQSRSCCHDQEFHLSTQNQEPSDVAEAEFASSTYNCSALCITQFQKTCRKALAHFFHKTFFYRASAWTMEVRYGRTDTHFPSFYGFQLPPSSAEPQRHSNILPRWQCSQPQYHELHEPLHDGTR